MMKKLSKLSLVLALCSTSFVVYADDLGCELINLPVSDSAPKTRATTPPAKSSGKRVAVKVRAQRDPSAVRSEVLYSYGQVSIRKPRGANKTLGVSFKRTLVNNGDEIQTNEQSFAVIRASDGSKITIPSNSKVTLKKITSAPLQLSLQKGRIDNVVAPQNKTLNKTPNKNFKYFIETPSINLGVRGTEFKVEHNVINDTSFVSVDEGLVEIQPKKRCELLTQLHKRDGAFIDATAVNRITTLDAPNLSLLPEIFTGNSAVLRFAAITNAKRYHVTAAHDKEFTYLIEESFNTDPALMLSRLDNGYYYIKVTAIDEQGVEGTPAISKILFQRVDNDN